MLLRHPMVAIGMLGLVARLLFLHNSQTDPSFFHPLVDAKTYHDLARGYSETGWHEKFLWQALGYPAFLSFIYQVFGVSLIAVKLIQALVGGISCALTFRLGEQLFGRRAGLLAGMILVFYGPVVFFESRLLATAWATFWTVSLAVLLLRCLMRPNKAVLITMGLALALAVYTRPTFLLIGAAVVGLLLSPNPTTSQSLRRRLMHVAFVVGGFALIAAPTSIFCKTTTGHWGLVPPSGGINLFIGNNSDYATTINIRPGLAWAALVAEPEAQGYEANPWAGNTHFRSQTWHYIKTDFAGFLTGLGGKTLTLMSSREIPRNLDLMLHREWSSGLRAAVWRWGEWGFPFGLIFPFALVGLLHGRGWRVRAVLMLLAVSAAALVLVFVSARYRAPLMPLVVVFAAHGVLETAVAVGRKQARKIGQIIAVLALGLVACTVPGPFAQESGDLKAELYFGVAEGLYDQENWQGAAEAMAQSLALDNEVHAAQQIMGIALANLNQFDRAIEHFRAAVRLRPNHGPTRSHLTQCQQDRARFHFLAGRDLELSDPAQALIEFKIAREDLPEWYKPIARTALVLATSQVDSVRDGKQAVALARSAVVLRGVDDAYLDWVLAAALAENGQYEAAVIIAERSLEGEQSENEAEELREALEKFTARQALRR